MRRLTPLCLLAMAACGEPHAPVIAATVRMDAQYREQVTRFDIYVFGPRMTDGTWLPCTALLDRDPRPEDPKLDVLASVHPAWTGSGDAGASLEAPSGSGRVVYVAAGIGTETVLHGCAEDVEVREGETTLVEIVLTPLAR